MNDNTIQWYDLICLGFSTYASWGQSRRVEPANAVQLSPALAKLSVGVAMVIRNAMGMIYMYVRIDSVN